MKKKLLLKCMLLSVLFANVAFSQTVSNNAQLQTAITNATAGSTIILTNGIWTNITINFKKTGTANGTLANPITIKAQTAGSVFLEGNSRIAMGGKYIKIEGLVFRNPSNFAVSSNTIEPVIKFRYDSSNLCSNCSVTNVKIDTYNGTEAQSLNTFKWIQLYGQYNEISYCSFIGKYGIGSVINDNRDDTTINYNKIHHNYFAGRTFVGTYVDENNDQDAIRIGNSATSLSDSYTEVYDNLFSNWQGEIEIISNKSCHNKYYNNTFRDYSGTLTLRHGNNCSVYNNFFFANDQLFSGGVRVVGENHNVYNNYFESVNSKKADGTTSSNLGGIGVLKGEASSPLNGYYQVKNLTITNNTFVNCDYGIRVGTGGETLPPLTMVIANNIFLMKKSSAEAVDELVTANSSYPYTYTGNIKQSGAWTLNGTVASNTTVTSGLLTSDTDFYRVKTGSAAINAGIGTYSFLTNDILYGLRPTAFDAGAEEFGANGTVLPYKVSDVGSKLGFLGSTTLSTESNFKISGIKLYPVPVKNGNVLNIEMEDAIGAVSIYDITEKLMYSSVFNENIAQIDINSFDKGVYIIKIKNASTRFIVE